jgi:predicted metalloprotease with PDZ domain
MKKYWLLGLFFFIGIFSYAQMNMYEITFENAIHHEALVSATFPAVTTDTLSVRMSRTSPGRYALHEFAKNVYRFKAYDGKGNSLKVHRPDPYQWQVFGHDGTVKIEYLLYANRGDGTYSQVDETHAHLNIPATFMYAPSLEERPIEVTFDAREDLNWKVATQLHLVSGTTYTAPNLQYFMDSPVEISDFGMREFDVDGQKIQFVLHHNGTDEELDTYFEKVKKTVLTEKDVYGELPNFDYGRYTFLACYIPNASGDGMEHRNSTILTSTRSLADGGMEGNIGTVSHEFFHAWNVERIRPQSLEPFDFEEANMSGTLWFAEGFTSYYTNLILCRAGLMAPEEYIEGLAGTFNYIWNSPARQFFNPIEMSYQAPFVDAATSVDPVNRENMFISYYSYGSVLGLALDLALREKGLDLDNYMKLVWIKYGKTQTPYKIKDLQNTLREYAGKEFGDAFFNSYIYKSEMPDYKSLFEIVGIKLETKAESAYLGISARLNGDGHGEITTNPKMGSPAYIAGLDKGDIITSMNGSAFPDGQQFDDFQSQFNPGDVLKIEFERFGQPKTTQVKLVSSPTYVIYPSEKKGDELTKKQRDARKDWLKLK